MVEQDFVYPLKSLVASFAMNRMQDGRYMIRAVPKAKEAAEDGTPVDITHDKQKISAYTNMAISRHREGKKPVEFFKRFNKEAAHGGDVAVVFSKLSNAAALADILETLGLRVSRHENLTEMDTLAHRALDETDPDSKRFTPPPAKKHPRLPERDGGPPKLGR